MRISELLNETTIKMSLEAKSKTAAIEELVDVLVEEHEISLSDRTAVISAVLKREEMISTGLELGIAIPHGAVDCVGDVVGALGICKEGMEFESMDGEPSHLIILLILPKDKYSAGVRTMAGITKLLTHDTLREQIVQATDSSEVMDVIIEEEERQFSEE